MSHYFKIAEKPLNTGVSAVFCLGTGAVIILQAYLNYTKSNRPKPKVAVTFLKKSTRADRLSTSRGQSLTHPSSGINLPPGSMIQDLGIQINNLHRRVRIFYTVKQLADQPLAKGRGVNINSCEEIPSCLYSRKCCHSRLRSLLPGRGCP